MEDIKIPSDAYARLVNWCTDLEKRIKQLEEINAVEGMVTTGAPKYVRSYISKQNAILKEGEIDE